MAVELSDLVRDLRRPDRDSKLLLRKPPSETSSADVPEFGLTSSPNSAPVTSEALSLLTHTHSPRL
jgi:hypothetical protein